MDKERFPDNYAVKKQKADLTDADLTEANLTYAKGLDQH